MLRRTPLPCLVQRSVNTDTFADGACEARSRQEEEDDAWPSSTTTNAEIVRNPHLPSGWRRDGPIPLSLLLHYGKTWRSASLRGLDPSRSPQTYRYLQNAVLVLLLLSGQFLQAEHHNAEKPLDIGTRLELFVDDYLIDSMTGEVDLKLHTTSSAGRVLDFYKPWEGTTCFYVSVVHGEGLYRMYYRGHSLPSAIAPSLVTPGETVVPEHKEVTCYAESRDGRIWTKPSLGIVEFQGSKDNNIIWDGFGTLNFMVFRDTNPATPAEQRYKALATGKPNRPQKRVVGMVSADGIHWKPIREKALLTQRPTDNGGDGFLWDRVRGEYVAYLRVWYPYRWQDPKNRRGPTIRAIGRATSPDFLNWSDLEDIDLGGAPRDHFYTNGITPYFRAPHIFLGFPKRFIPWRTRISDAPDSGSSDAVFMTSRDGLHWDRTFLESFIRPGRDPKNWINRGNLTATGVVETADDEISLYVLRNYKSPSIHMERMTLRTDGFASLRARYSGGEVLTKPLKFEGSNLVLNFATSAAGSIRLEIQDEDGSPLPGFSLAESPLIWGDEIAHTVRWKRSHSQATSDKPLRRVAGKAVRLRFVMKDADLYSVRFQ